MNKQGDGLLVNVICDTLPANKICQTPCDDDDDDDGSQCNNGPKTWGSIQFDRHTQVDSHHWSHLELEVALTQNMGSPHDFGTKKPSEM